MSEIRNATIRRIDDLPTSHRVQEMLRDAVHFAYNANTTEADRLVEKAIQEVSLEAYYDDRNKARRVLEFIDGLDLYEISDEGRDERRIANGIDPLEKYR